MATWSRCVVKQVMGCAGWWVAPSPLVLLQGYANGWGYPQQGNLRETIPPGLPCLDPQLRWIDFACLLLVTTLMKLIHWGFSPLTADSSASHGSRRVSNEVDEQLLHLLHTRPSLLCTVCRWLTTVPSFWPSFPHQGQWVKPLKWQRASGLCISTNPITFGDSDGGTTWRNLRSFGKDLRA